MPSCWQIKKLPNRIKSTSFFGNTEYSKEELVAEVGANMIMSALGIENDAAQKNSIAYLQGWLQALKNDMTMIVSACSKAQKAADYILEHKRQAYSTETGGRQWSK